jgi:hypothetical protein
MSEDEDHADVPEEIEDVLEELFRAVQDRVRARFRV